MPARKTTCKKRGAMILINFGNRTRNEALSFIEALNKKDMECPGQHVEFGGWRSMWNLDKVVCDVYDNHLTDPVPETVTDKQFVKTLVKEGHMVIDGGQGTVPEMELTRIQRIPGLHHTGFGNFASDTHIYERVNNPTTGTRFYIEHPRK
jgi:hypothetical protein